MNKDITLLDIPGVLFCLILLGVAIYLAIVFFVPLSLENKINKILSKRQDEQSHDEYVRGKNEGLTDLERKFFKTLAIIGWIPILNGILLVLLWCWDILTSFVESFIYCLKSTQRIHQLVKKPGSKS